MNAARRNKILALVVAFFAGLTVTIVITINGPAGQPPVSITYTLPTTVSPKAPEVVIDPGMELGPKEQAQDADPTPIDEGPGIHEDLRDETPPGAPPDAAREVMTAPVTGIGKPLPLGGAQIYDCRWHPVQNSSKRNAGARVVMIALHVAVVRPNSHALPVIFGLFDTPSFGASSSIGMEVNGQCEQWVAYDRKPWTQLTFNSVSESVEIMAMGTESRAWWLAQPIFKKGILAAWVSDRLRANGLPPKLVDPVGCTPLAGFTDHARLECGNTHVDVGTGFPFDVLERQVRRAYRGGNPRPIPCTARNVEKVLASRFPSMRIVVDGRIGNRSRAAIRRVQRGNYLRVDGVVGPRTGRVLGLKACGA